MSSHVIFQKFNRVGVMTLNRPKHLNVLSTEMISKMHAQLNSWVYSDVPTRQIDPKIDLLILEANYDNQKTRSFCAGGDVREMTQGGLGNQTGKNFMFHEYQFDLKLAEMFQKTKIPLITFLDGIVMGGGVGISIHSQYKIVTENTKFAMPETSIGSFPDVGTSYFMHQILNADQKFENLARYLALTGDIISSFDCQKINVGTHFIWSKNLETVKNLILENPEKLDQILADFAVETWAESSRLDEIREDIKLGFAGNSVAEIFENLGNLESEFAQKTLQKLKKLSPTSLEVTFEQIKLGKNPDHTLRDALNLEYSLGCQFMDEPNFFEGVRAILVDKTFDPKWSAKPENVSRYFTDKKYQWLSVEW